MFVSVVTPLSQRVFADAHKGDSKHLLFAWMFGVSHEFQLVIADHAEQSGKQGHVGGSARCNRAPGVRCHPKYV